MQMITLTRSTNSALISRLCTVLVMVFILQACDEPPLDVNWDPIDLESLSLEKSLIPADGRTAIMVEAIIPQGSRLVPRQVTFSTTAGKFFPGEGSHVTVTVDPAGRAVVILQAPDTPTSAIIRARAGETTLQDTVRFHLAPPDLRDLVVSSNNVIANGVETTQLRATIPPSSTINPRTVTFTTTAGTFLPGGRDSLTVNIDSAGVALVLLRTSSHPGTAVVTAQAGRTLLRETVTFVRAFPERMELGADSYRAEADPATKIRVHANLYRSNGKVSPGAIVRFAVQRNAEGEEIGWFGNVSPSNENGTASAEYIAGGTTHRGPISIVAETIGADGEMIFGRMTIEIVSPRE